MLLAVSIGNTHVACAMYEDDLTRVRTARIPASTISLEHLQTALGSLECVSHTVLASVDPEKTAAVSEALETLTGKSPQHVRDVADCGLDISAYDASLLGIDRVLCCVGALVKYMPPLAVFDLGTAMSISVLDDTGAFMGGAIMPGLQMSLDALAHGTALLPQLSPKKNAPLIGRNTAGCMLSGVVNGAAAAMDGYARRLYGVLCIATGGGAQTVLPACKEEFLYEPELLLDGLAYTCQNPADEGNLV